MDAAARIRQLMQEKGWSMYMLSKQAGLSNTTLQTMYARNTAPSLATIEAVCSALGITLAQFFADGEANEPAVLDARQKQYLEQFALLSDESKDAILQIMRLMK